MTSVSDEGSASTSVRGMSLIRGPRFVDLPIRLLALIMGLTVLIPGSFEIDEPRYVMLIIVAYALFFLAPFMPLLAGLLSTGLSLIFVMFYPDLENMFPEVLIFAAAVLLSHRRWTAAVIATLGLATYLATCTELGAYDGGLAGFIDLGFGWLTYSLLGLAAGLVEARIRREITRRERAAVEHQQDVESMRARFTSDMHDTLSNSLATETAIIRTMARTTGSPESERLLAELSLVNAEATKRLRHLVTSLSSGETQGQRIRLHTEMRQLAAMIESGCAAGSIRLSTHVAELPTYASAALGQHYRAILLELATNVIRYSTPGTPAALDVEMRRNSDGRTELVCRSTNETETELSETPRSLSRRARRVGGTCRVIPDEGHRVIVEVVLPVRYVTAGTDDGTSPARGPGQHTEGGAQRGAAAGGEGVADEIDVLCSHDDPMHQDTSDAHRAGASANTDDTRKSAGAAAASGGSELPESEHSAWRENRIEA
ncbi:hypothetical protein [Brevibacterium sp. FAM 24638]|uniref:hypothetical protein n=1 Tax=Brevibacterium sp. FAM 24638 TaxID=3415681 RepID=UPI003C7D7860